jgi:O-antigen/teichoic acid export membrane protein
MAADQSQQKILLLSVVKMTSLVLLILMALLLVLTPFMVPFLFGSAYRDAVPVAQILVVAGAIGNLNMTLEDCLRGLGRPRQVLAAEVLGMIVTVALLWLLLPSLNIFGAALASLVAYAAITLRLAYAIRREVIKR